MIPKLIEITLFCVQEFDHPHILLQNENGVLYQMVEETGHTMAESLLKIARTVSNFNVNKLFLLQIKEDLF